MKMTSLKRLLTVSLLLLLTACGNAGIAAISTIGSAAMVYGGQVISRDTAEAEKWRNNHQGLVTECNTSLLIRVRDVSKKDFDDILARCDKLMMFSYNNMPEIFVERMLDRVRRAKEGRETVVPGAREAEPRERLSFPSSFPEVLR